MVLAGILILTPAGAAVHRWINQTLGVKHPRTALFSLPAAGQILVAGPGGVWTVAADGSKRRLGSGQEATWSPHAMYVAVASGNQLTAVNPHGTPQWSIARPDVRSPTWYAPNGYRLAYLSGGTLRVIAGDGTGDRELARSVARVGPAWRPGHPYALAYAQADGTVMVRDADTGRLAWSRRTPARPRLLAWSADGARLLVLTQDGALLFDASGGRLGSAAGIGGEAVRDGALSPDGREIALLSGGQVTLTDIARPGSRPRRLFTGADLGQLSWSPDGRWLLIGWPAADQWVFIRVIGQPRLTAVSRIAQQFGGLGLSNAFPSLEGWCCTPTTGAG
jgi:WD40 repeat protein